MIDPIVIVIRACNYFTFLVMYGIKVAKAKDINLNLETEENN